MAARAKKGSVSTEFRMVHFGTERVAEHKFCNNKIRTALSALRPSFPRADAPPPFLAGDERARRHPRLPSTRGRANTCALRRPFYALGSGAVANPSALTETRIALCVSCRAARRGSC
jgi:hypothetical protein